MLPNIFQTIKIYNFKALTKNHKNIWQAAFFGLIVWQKNELMLCKKKVTNINNVNFYKNVVTDINSTLFQIVTTQHTYFVP